MIEPHKGPHKMAVISSTGFIRGLAAKPDRVSKMAADLNAMLSL